MKLTIPDWLILAVGLGLLVYALATMFVNGFAMHLMYPLLLGFINIGALWLLQKRKK